MEEDCTGSQGPQQTAAVEDERFVIQTVFNHHAILSPVLCTLPVQPNFIHNTYPEITICFQTAAVNKVFFATRISVLTTVNIKTALL